MVRGRPSRASGLDKKSGLCDFYCIQMADATLIKLSRDGLKILGCPMGTDTFCANTLARTALKIEADLQALAVFSQRIKMATFCTNTRPSPGPRISYELQNFTRLCQS